MEDYGLRRVLGLPTQEPFQKTHVEVAYSDANNAQWTYATPTTGTSPRRGPTRPPPTQGCWNSWGSPRRWGPVHPDLDVDGRRPPRPSPSPAGGSMTPPPPPATVLVPNSRVEAVFQEVGFTPQGPTGPSAPGPWM